MKFVSLHRQSTVQSHLRVPKNMCNVVDKTSISKLGTSIGGNDLIFFRLLFWQKRELTSPKI